MTDYNFREIPEAHDEFEEFSTQPFFHAGPNDIFPEEFIRFLIGNRKLKAIFLELHGDLYNFQFWKNTQKRIKQGELIDVYPYREALCFKHLFEEQE